jgi:ferrous iron transport protein B
VALVGSPNSGKTTLFNWLTGLRYKTVNYPGATVEYSMGETNERYGAPVLVMDTPGTYSLNPKSPEEQVTIRAIFSHIKYGTCPLIISVVDATQMSRHLLITRQLQAAGFPVIVALTMVDLIRERGEHVNVAALSEELGCKIIEIDGRLGGGVMELVEEVRQSLLFCPLIKLQPLEAWSGEKTETVLREVAQIQKKVMEKKVGSGFKKKDALERTAKIDRVLLHPVFGLVIFTVIMALLFTAIFWAAQPLMDAVDFTFTSLGNYVLSLAPDSLWASFLSKGVIASFGAVLIFVPQIFILFLGIVSFEDSGYLARTATLVDRPFSFLGLNGRSFVPILSAYACAVPAMMAARTINSRRERWLTLFVIPLMSCSARLPVYALLLSFLYRGQPAWKAGVTLAGLYLGSLMVGAIAAAIANRFLKIKDKSFFMLELPVYRTPKFKSVLRSSLSRTYSYIRRAGPAIFIFALIIWIGTNFPRIDLKDPTERLSQSYAAQLGHYIEPVFRPMGGDWRTGVGLISAFAAREVFVSSLAVVFSVTEPEESMRASLLTKMSEARAPDGLPLFTFASVIGLMIFFMIALQCLSTVSVAFRESGRWQFAIFQLVVFNLVAYALTVGIVQGLRAVGIN